jgi:type VI secretion system secreted protein Hcp
LQTEQGHRTRSATASTAGGHTAERAEVQDITFSKITDLSTPLLLQTCATGKSIAKVKFQFMRADGNGKPIAYFEIELENLIIGAIHPGLEGGGLLSEHVSLKSAKSKWRYTQQKTAGGSGGSTIGGWDSAANKVI